MSHNVLVALTPEQHALVLENLGLCFLAAKQPKPSLTYGERLSAAYLGICYAARSFDPSMGSGFSFYAYRWAQSKIRDDIKLTRQVVRIPRGHEPLRWKEAVVTKMTGPSPRSWARIETRPDLPLRTRVMLRLRFDEDISSREIGSIFGVTYQAVCTAINLGLDLLRRDPVARVRTAKPAHSRVRQ